jgi:hypothetical protein
MHDLKHLNARLIIISEINLSISDRASRNVDKSFSWPVCEPIDSTTVDQRWELSQPFSEDFSKRRHRDRHMNVRFDALQVALHHVHLVDSETTSVALSLTNLEDGV